MSGWTTGGLKTGILRLATAAALAGAAAGCAGTIDSHGHVMRDGTLQELRPGVQTRDEVAQLLGSPSSTAPFDDSTWYYIGQRTRTVAFFKPEVEERRVLVLRFDESGVMDSMAVLSEADGEQIAYVDRETPTAGHEMTFMEQLLGNMGRFSAGSSMPTKRGGGMPGSY